MPKTVTEDFYQQSWRRAHDGARTDWFLIGEPAREAWRVWIDGALFPSEGGPDDQVSKPRPKSKSNPKPSR
jgi:hypothetical protein